MSTLRVSKIQTAAVDEDLTLTTGNTSSPSLVISSSNDNIFLNGTLYGLNFPEVTTAVSYAYTTANAAADIAYAAADAANAAAAGVDISPAFNQANTALSTAQAAFGKANTAQTTAVNAFGKANTALSTAQAAFSTANNAASTGKAIAMAIVFG